MDLKDKCAIQSIVHCLDDIIWIANNNLILTLKYEKKLEDTLTREEALEWLNVGVKEGKINTNWWIKIRNRIKHLAKHWNPCNIQYV